ncbi:MAG TPA: outer membrane lipoprotein carrier protein LolA [Membranihabitans sp.]|nr:outer membrane lipoprotein carrier protein LolA [Membranihabitans sp.]
MKNIINLFALLILPALSVPSLSQDQNLGKAVQKVIDKYQDAKALKLDFEFQLTYPEKTPQIFEGTFYKLGDKYKVDLDQFTIFSDGRVQYSVQKEAREVQITTVDTETIELSSPAGVLKYLEDQKFRYFDQSALNQGSQALRIIEMIPVDQSSEYFKIRFSFTEKSEAIKYIEIFARDGQRIQLTVGDTSFSGNFPQNTVEWNPDLYKDYYIEDLRID